jgi:hypothetical protein
VAGLRFGAFAGQIDVSALGRLVVLGTMMNRSAVAALGGLVLAVATPSMASASEFGAIAF